MKDKRLEDVGFFQKPGVIKNNKNMIKTGLDMCPHSSFIDMRVSRDACCSLLT